MNGGVTEETQGLFFGSLLFAGIFRSACVAAATLNLMRGAAPRAGHFLLRGQEKVTKEVALAHPCARDISTSLYVKAACLCAMCRMHECREAQGCARAAFSSFQGRSCNSRGKRPPRSNMHSLTPEITAMLGCVHGGLASPWLHQHVDFPSNPR